jgi:hypothetical protein
MGVSENAVYDFIQLVNNGKRMINDITTDPLTIKIYKNKQLIATFSSAIHVELTHDNNNALIVEIIEDEIKKYIRYAVFWTNYYDFKLNGNSLEIRDKENTVVISIYIKGDALEPRST